MRNIELTKPKIIVAIVCIAVILLIIGGMVNKKPDTKPISYEEEKALKVAEAIAETKSKTQTFIDNCRSGVETGWLHIDYIDIGWIGRNNPKMEEFVIKTIDTLYDNGEIDILNRCISGIDSLGDFFNENIYDYLQNKMNNPLHPEYAVELIYALDYFDYKNLEISKDSAFILTYIDDQGMNPISTTPGTGYYADKENESKHETIGISGSPLYSDFSIIYMGDFKKEIRSGVTLDYSDYQEKSYYDTTCYFNDCMLSDPRASFDSDYNMESYDYIWSGNYLFVFDSFDGELVQLIKVNK